MPGQPLCYHLPFKSHAALNLHPSLHLAICYQSELFRARVQFTVAAVAKGSSNGSQLTVITDVLHFKRKITIEHQEEVCGSMSGSKTGLTWLKVFKACVVC